MAEIQCSLGAFPLTPSLKDQCGLPFGCVVRPLARSLDNPTASSSSNGDAPAALPRASEVARCQECYGYVSGFCQFTRYGWTCALCGAYTEYPRGSEYAKTTSRRARPELQADNVELELWRANAGGVLEQDGEDSSAGADGAEVGPITVALVDLHASEPFVELVKSALLAALEALPPASRFALVTFSHKVGLYDLQGDTPVLKRVPLNPTNQLELEQAMPLNRLLARVQDYKEAIADAVEMLQPIPQWERQQAEVEAAEAAEAGQDQQLAGGRCLGAAMEAVLDYLGAQGEPLSVLDNGFHAMGDGAAHDALLNANIHLLTFLAGIPNAGPGLLLPPEEQEREEDASGEGLDLLLQPQSTFYRQLAARAADAGIVVDLMVASPTYCDLASLRFLCSMSGGVMLLYRTLEDSTLPQDLYRRLRQLRGLGGVLRLRTSVEFQPVRAAGPCIADQQYDNLYHVLACDSYDTFAFDFEFTAAQGFSQAYPPILQLAFQYTVLVPEPFGEAGADGKRPVRYIQSRRLRLRTMSLRLATSAKEVYAHAAPDVILALVQHKIVRASLEEGLAEGRALLQDWLVILTAHYNEHYGLAKFGEGAAAAALDVTFAKCDALQQLPRLVFALLRSPLLCQPPAVAAIASAAIAAPPPSAVAQSPAATVMNAAALAADDRVYLQSLYSALPPSALLRAIYPVLSSYKTPDEEAFPRHSLSRAALITSGSPIFLLDTFTSIIVYYAPHAPAALPYPPPQTSALRKTINALKAERVITPRLHFLKGGVDPVTLFEEKLIEEQDADVPGVAPGMGFVGFLDLISAEVRSFMSS